MVLDTHFTKNCSTRETERMMMAERRKVDRGLNLGDILHVVQIIVLGITIGVFYAESTANVVVTKTHTEQLNRIEHYLSSKDPNYYETSRRNE